MKEIIVDLHNAARPLYREIYNYPPAGIKYNDIQYTATGKFEENPFKAKKSLTQKTKNIINNLPIIGTTAAYLYYRFMAKNILGNGQLVHLCNDWTTACTKLKRPYVCDVENVGVFVNFKFNRLNHGFFRRLIEKECSSKYCKAILPTTRAAKKSIEFALDIKNFKDKIEVVYPAIHEIKYEKIKSEDRKIRLLFVGFSFDLKGGIDVLNAFRTLASRFDVSLDMVSLVPEKIKKKFSDLPVKFFEHVPITELYSKFYPAADIFILPTYTDSIGFVFFEAKAFSLPTIATTHFATPEIVEDGKTGLLINAPISVFNEKYQYVEKNLEILRTIPSFPSAVKQIVEKTSFLIENDNIREKMGRNAHREIEKGGKFSIDERNKKLRRIYEEALRG